MSRYTVEVGSFEKANRFRSICNVCLRMFVLAVTKAEQILGTVNKNLIPTFARVVDVRTFRDLKIYLIQIRVSQR